MITKEQFLAYEAVRQSGKTNMLHVGNVQALAAASGTFLSREQIHEIMKGYESLRAEFGDGRLDALLKAEGE